MIVFVRTTAVSNNYTREIITLACTNMHTHSHSRMHPLADSFVRFWEANSLFFVLFDFQINQTILNSRRGFDKNNTNKKHNIFSQVCWSWPSSYSVVLLYLLWGRIVFLSLFFFFVDRYLLQSLLLDVGFFRFCLQNPDTEFVLLIM